MANVTTRNNQLREEIRSLARQRESVGAAVQHGDTSLVQIRSDLNRVLGWSGALGVSGAGVRVSVDGALPGDAVEQLLNELRNAGAEAISIGGIRIVPGVVVAGPPDALTVAGNPWSGRARDPGHRPPGGTRRVARPRRWTDRTAVRRATRR